MAMMLVYEGTQYPLEGELVLGRHRECGIQIKDEAASRRHCRVFVEDGRVWAEDLGSANGIKHNGERFTGRRQLRNGDALRIGKSEIQYFGPETPAEPQTASAPALDPASLAGRTIAGHRLDSALGRGGMGYLYRATQLNLDRQVAFKVFNRALSAEAGFAERFKADFGKAAGLTHQALVAVHQSGVEEGLVWYTMELVEGEPLKAMIERDGRMDALAACVVCERIAGALAEAHARGLVHRSLSLNTVLLTREGKVKIADLGLAQVLGRGRDPRRAEDAWHLCPEVVAGQPPLPRDDVYSLGCLWYHLLTGSPPFAGADAAAVLRGHREEMIPSLERALPGMPPKAGEVLASLINKNPEWRYSSMGEAELALRAVRQLVASKPLPPPPKQTAASVAAAAEAARERRALEKSQSQHRMMLRVGVVVLIVVVIAILAATLGMFRPRPEAPPPEPMPVIIPAPTASSGRPRIDIPVSAATAAPTPPTPGEAALARWRDDQKRIAALVGTGDWGAAEMVLERSRADAGKSASATWQQESKLRRQQFDLEAEGWYQQQLQAIPAGEGPDQLAARLSSLSRLRDVVASPHRADAEARYQEALARLVQSLNAARRRARQALEAGQLDAMAATARDLAPAFAGTPVAGLHRQFAVLVEEAARIKPFWRRDWNGTRENFASARGEGTISSAAALMIAGETTEAKRRLSADPLLAGGDLRRRRERLLGREAAILGFDDPGDLLAIEVLQGEPRLQGGALTGPAAQPVALACVVPVGGDTWSAAFSVTLPQAGEDGELVLSCAVANEPRILVRIGKEQVAVRAVGEGAPVERSVPRPQQKVLRVRFACRAGELAVLVGDQVAAECRKPQVPPDSQIRLECAGFTWRLEDLQVVGGGGE